MPGDMEPQKEAPKVDIEEKQRKEVLSGLLQKIDEIFKDYTPGMDSFQVQIGETIVKIKIIPPNSNPGSTFEVSYFFEKNGRHSGSDGIDPSQSWNKKYETIKALKRLIEHDLKHGEAH